MKKYEINWGCLVVMLWVIAIGIILIWAVSIWFIKIIT